MYYAALSESNYETDDCESAKFIKSESIRVTKFANIRTSCTVAIFCVIRGQTFNIITQVMIILILRVPKDS